MSSASRKRMRITIDILMLMVMFILPLSGIAMSRHLLVNFPMPIQPSTARIIHMLASHWGLIIMSFHAGLHIKAIIGKLKLQNRSEKESSVKRIRYLIKIGKMLCVLYGIYAMIKHQFVDYLFLKIQFVFFDYSAGKMTIIMDYAAITILFIIVGCQVDKQMKNIRKKR